MRLFDILIIGVHKVLHAMDKEDTAYATRASLIVGLLLGALFSFVFIDVFFVSNHTFGYYCTETSVIDLIFYIIIVSSTAFVYFYIVKIMGEEKLDTKLSMKEKIISFLFVFSIVSFCIFSASLTREQSFEYRRKSGWYEQHPNKPSLLGRIENWFREKNGDKENNK